MAEETSCTVFPAMKSLYEEKKLLMDREMTVLPGVNMSFYDLHDGKMLYMLTQHSQWNRKYHPFLLWKCKHSDGVTDENHECVQFSHQEQIHYFARSQNKWERSREKHQNNYTSHMHNNWIDKDNYGISHCGIPPHQLHRHNIRFDIFHMQCSITKNLMGYLCTFILSQNSESLKKFSRLLLSFLSDFHGFVWSSNNSFSSFQGNELSKFTQNIPIIIQFLTD